MPDSFFYLFSLHFHLPSSSRSFIPQITSFSLSEQSVHVVFDTVSYSPSNIPVQSIRLPHDGYRLSASSDCSALLLPAGKIDPKTASVSIHLLSPTFSESPISSSLDGSNVTSTGKISAFKVPTLNTDNYQQTWLPSTLPQQQPLARPVSNSQPRSNSNINSSINSNGNSNSNLPSEDFVLYPSTSAACTEPSPWDDRRQTLSGVSPRTAPVTSPTPVGASPHLLSVKAPIRHSPHLQHHEQSFSPSQIQARQGNGLVSSAGCALDLHASNLRRRQLAQRSSAAALLANSPAAWSPAALALLQRASNSFSFPHQSQPRRVMSTSSIPQGEFNLISVRLLPSFPRPPPHHPLSSVHESSQGKNADLEIDLSGLFDLSGNQFVDEFESTPDLIMFPPKDMPRSGFTAVNDSPVNPLGTVSPTDLFKDTSAPPSTSFTDMSTPSFESPALFSQDTSPVIATDHELGPGAERWESLFPNDGFSDPLEDVTTVVDSLAKSGLPTSPMIRTASSPGGSPNMTNGHDSSRHSSVSGVNSRRRDKPLPPIKYDAMDPVAAKRARNTEAARKSRARKIERQDAMERRISELEEQLKEVKRSEQYWKTLAQTRC